MQTVDLNSEQKISLKVCITNGVPDKLKTYNFCIELFRTSLILVVRFYRRAVVIIWPVVLHKIEYTIVI